MEGMSMQNGEVQHKRQRKFRKEYRINTTIKNNRMEGKKAWEVWQCNGGQGHKATRMKACQWYRRRRRSMAWKVRKNKGMPTTQKK